VIGNVSGNASPCLIGKFQEQVVADVIVIPLLAPEPSSPLLQHHRVLHQFYVTYQYKKEYAQLLLFYQHQCEQQFHISCIF
jgi:hypothetical protein